MTLHAPVTMYAAAALLRPRCTCHNNYQSLILLAVLFICFTVHHDNDVRFAFVRCLTLTMDTPFYS